MPTGNDRFARVKEYLEHLDFYREKYGVIGAVRTMLARVWSRTVGEAEWFYSFDLQKDRIRSADSEGPLRLLSFSTPSDLDAQSLGSLRKYKSSRACARFLESWFSRGATLWLSCAGDDVVGLQWTITGGLGGFYSIPVGRDEAIIVAVEVFPPYRGKGLYPRMLSQLLPKLKDSGHRRAFLKVAASNTPMLRAIAKMDCDRVGRVYTCQTRKHLITVWNRAQTKTP